MANTKIIAITTAFFVLYKGYGPVFAQNKTRYHYPAGCRIYQLNHKTEEANRDTAISKLLTLYQDSLSVKMDETIIYNATPLTKAQPESTLGNWIADAARNTVGTRGPKTDACIIAYSSIGQSYLAPGPVRRKDFYDLIPYENRLLLVMVNGRLLNLICDSIATAKGLPVSGITFVIDGTKAIQTRINRQAVKEDLIYTILINDYLLSTRTFAALLGKLPYEQSGFLLRNSLLQYAAMLHEKGAQIHSAIENRISYAE